MREFTERFKPRFLELPNDVDDNVAVKGVSLPPATCISLHQPPESDGGGVTLAAADILRCSCLPSLVA